jgi:hypothetical protein
MKRSNARRAKGPNFLSAGEAKLEQVIDVSLKTPETLRDLQRKLYCAAKSRPEIMCPGEAGAPKGARDKGMLDSQAVNQVGEPDAGNPHVRFDERDVETESRQGYWGTAKRKRRQTVKLNLPPPRHIWTLLKVSARGVRNADWDGMQGPICSQWLVPLAKIATQQTVQAAFRTPATRL